MNILSDPAGDDTNVRVDHTARLWDARSGKHLPVLLGHHDSVNSAAFSPDGRYIITTGRDVTAKIYSAVESDLLKEYLAGALHLLRFQKEFDAVRRFEPYFAAQATLSVQATRP
ncbi:MAG TPA: hypothetical protein VNS63_01560 [Blastocatellia bacterium]|nr:hypothetical protein [Blastocatellia bacterium]